jgi:hypothetical protein
MYTPYAFKGLQQPRLKKGRKEGAQCCETLDCSKNTFWTLYQVSNKLFLFTNNSVNRANK